MSGIVCAIRGGPHSQPTINKAISLARETELTIYFLYIVNLDFFIRTASSRTHTIREDMEQMGEFILLAAQSKAQAESIAAERVIRQGNVGEVIVELAQTLHADYVVLGSPQGERDKDVFTLNRLQKFAQHIETESGARVVLAERGDA